MNDTTKTAMYVNGKSADLIVKLVVALVALIIICTTAIIITNHEVPAELKGVIPSALTGLLGLLAGTRIVTPDVSAQIKTEALTQEEQKVLKNGTHK